MSETVHDFLIVFTEAENVFEINGESKSAFRSWFYHDVLVTDGKAFVSSISFVSSVHRPALIQPRSLVEIGGYTLLVREWWKRPPDGTHSLFLVHSVRI